MAKERKRLINEDMVSEIPPVMHHPVPSVTASVHHRRFGKTQTELLCRGLCTIIILWYRNRFIRDFFHLGGRFHVRGRTGNDNSGILTCADDNNDIQTENIREEDNGIDKESGELI